MTKDDAGETWVLTEAGPVRVVLDRRCGVRRQRSFLDGKLITDERAEELGIPNIESMAKNTVMGRG